MQKLVGVTREHYPFFLTHWNWKVLLNQQYREAELGSAYTTMILLILKATSSFQDSHEAIWPNADQNFRGKIVLQFISNNTLLFSGLCRSLTECKSTTDSDNILYTATLNRPYNYRFYSLETTPTGFYTRKRKEQCRDKCERKCKSW